MRCDASELIDLRFGWKINDVEETSQSVKATVTDLNKGEKWIFESKYMIGCDGASSRVRRSLGIDLDGGPT